MIIIPNERWYFDHTTKWYMHKPKSNQENKVHEILKNFDIQTDHLIPASRPDLEQINNNYKKRERERERENLSCRVCHSSRPSSENKRKCKDKQMIGPCQRTKKKACGTCGWRWYQLWVVHLKLSLKDCKRNGTVETTGRIKTIQIIALLRSARILRKVQVISRDLLSLRFQGKPTS